MSSGGGGTQYVQSTSNTSNIPSYAQPYYENLLGSAQNTYLNQPYTTYQGQRIADFTPQQQNIQNTVAGLRLPGQFGTGTNVMSSAAQGLLGQNYSPTTFNAQNVQPNALSQYYMSQPQNVVPQVSTAPTMSAAQTGYAPGLQNFQLNGPQTFDTAAAQQYMSPYMQSAVNVQKQQAIHDAQLAQLGADLGAARQGTYGGSRELLAQMERERNLGLNLSNIQAAGQQQAYQNAMAQFNADQARQQQTGLANQQAALGVQQLGTQTGLQTALANLSSDQQAQVQNLAAQLQTQGLNQQQALQAALANQQMGFNTGQQNLQSALNVQQLGAQQGLQAALANQQYGLQAQQLGEQSRQFGANLGLQGLQSAAQAGQGLGQLGAQQQASNLSLLQQQQSTAAQQQELNQQYLTQAYQDFLNQMNYPNQQLQNFSAILHGISPSAGSSSMITAAQPSLAQQLMGGGIGALGLSNLLGGKTGG